MRSSHGFLCLCLILLTAPPATGAVRQVPAQFATIHAAVQASAAGDTVLVAAGTYHDCTHPTAGAGSLPACVIMKSGVTLRGAGTDATIIDPQRLGCGIFAELVSDCRIENLQVTAADAPFYGAGLLLRQVDASVRVTDVRAAHNFDGGVICINNGSPTLTRVACTDNVAKQGGGLSIEDNSSPVVTDCEILRNTAPSGAGVFIRNNSAPVLNGCTVSDNVINAQFGNGGGICVVAAAPLISYCTISGNTTLGYGGGLALIDGAAGEVRFCLIAGNHAAGDYSLGGGVSVLGATTRLLALTIVDNDALGFYAEGGGIDCSFTPSAAIENCTIAANRTGPNGFGGGISCQFGADPAVTRCIVASSVTGAGLFCNGSEPTVACSDVWGNAGGDAFCGIDGGGNFSADPRFDGGPGSEWRIRPDSPCAPGRHPGGGPCADALIGAVPDGASVTAVRDAPGPLQLLGVAPNPFNPRTTAAFVLAAPGRVTVRLYDLAGRLVRDLSPGDLSAGRHDVTWDGRTGAGGAAASGVYLLEVAAHGTRQARRLVLAR